MRYLKYGFLAALTLVLLVIALANRGAVTLRLMPGELAGLPGGDLTAEVPLFLIIFAGIIAGILIGFVWEWLREMKHRGAARETAHLKREVSRLQEKSGDVSATGGSDVLALLESGKS